VNRPLTRHILNSSLPLQLYQSIQSLCTQVPSDYLSPATPFNPAFLFTCIFVDQVEGTRREVPNKTLLCSLNISTSYFCILPTYVKNFQVLAVSISNHSSHVVLTLLMDIRCKASNPCIKVNSKKQVNVAAAYDFVHEHKHGHLWLQNHYSIGCASPIGSVHNCTTITKRQGMEHHKLA